MAVCAAALRGKDAHAWQIKWVLLISRQGKVRLSKWYGTMSQKNKNKIVKDVTQLVLARRVRSRGRPPATDRTVAYVQFYRVQGCVCRPVVQRLTGPDTKVVYRRYASLFFVAGIAQGDNELVTLEIIHRYVEVLDRYFGNVCELDLYVLPPATIPANPQHFQLPKGLLCM